MGQHMRFFFAQIPLLINAHVDIFYGARVLNFGLSLHLHPFFMYVSSNGSDDIVDANARQSLHHYHM